MDQQKKKIRKANTHESDTQRIIHRHLKNKDDIITDEDIRNVQVGSTPAQLDEATLARFEEEGLPDTSESRSVSAWDIIEEEE